MVGGVISKLSVQGFKSLHDTTVELGLVNVFIGANGSGKSNLLEALGVMGAAAFGSVEPETLRYRGVRPGLPALYKTSFRHLPFRRIVTLETEATGARATYRLGLDNPINSPSVRWRIASESLLEASGTIVSRSRRGCRLYEANGTPQSVAAQPDQTMARLALAGRPDAQQAHDLLENLTDYAIFSPTTPVLRGISQDEVSRDPLGLSGGGLPEAIKHLTDRTAAAIGPFDLEDVWELIDWADDMAAVPAPHAPLSPAVKTTPIVLRFRDRFMRAERNTLSAYDASEGALYVLFILALAAHPRAPRVFAVDNFDQALHPRLASALTRLVSTHLAEDGNRQMLATTHNPLVLDGLDLRDDRVRLFAVDRDRQGVTRVERVLVSEELLAEAERGLSLSRLWVMGRLGGVPRNL